MVGFGSAASSIPVLETLKVREPHRAPQKSCSEETHLALINQHFPNSWGHGPLFKHLAAHGPLERAFGEMLL